MVYAKDDWEKPRTRQQHLTRDEIQTLRNAFNSGLKATEAARSVSCSSRIAYKYFAMFRTGAIPKRAPQIKPVKFANVKAIQAIKNIPPPPPVRASRFYKGNFEL